MFERFKNRNSADEGAATRTAGGDRTATREAPEEDRGATRTAEDRANGGDRPAAGRRGEGRTVTDDGGADERRTAGDPRVAEDDRPAARDERTFGRGRAGAAAPMSMDRIRARQREEYGGINWGSAFFGWLVAVGVAVLLTGILAAAGAAIGLTSTTSNAADKASPETLSVAGAVALLIVLAIAYYCGGYVAGRMSRFDGARQGIGVWIVGLLITIAAAILAVIAGSQYNVVERANLPHLPVGSDTLTAGGAIASVLILLGTLLCATLGGTAGSRYHRKVDRVGYAE